ncbi:MAG TPA: hypothetical protein VK249_08680 [Anaerolineales bacterium]|nr:hypothetical protein [Anaerolineales bacterium]
MITRDESLKYRFIDFASRQSYNAGQTAKDSIDKTFDFIETRYLPEIRDAGQSSFLSNKELKGALRHLAGLGRQVYSDFVPEHLRNSIRGLENGSILTFISDNIGIPWELVYNGIDFWGRRFVIHKLDTMYDLPLQPITLGYEKVLNIVGANVQQPAKRQALNLFRNIEGSFSDFVNIDGGKIDSIEDVYEEIADADIIHITSHGQLDERGGLYLQIVRESRAYLNLTPAVIGVLPIKPGCLVFANACVSAGSQPGIEKSIRFGTMFCSNEKQGGAFIGTLDLIPDEPAIEFAHCFYYEYFFRGFPVGEALRLAKGSQLAHGKTRYGLFPLVYSLYGNPFVEGVPLYE